jgi:hypothetical protein
VLLQDFRHLFPDALRDERPGEPPLTIDVHQGGGVGPGVQQGGLGETGPPGVGEHIDILYPHLAGVSLEMQAKALALTLDAAFPGRVRVEYINVLTDPRGPSLPQTALLNSKSYPTPLVYLNGQGRFAGALIPERIREEVAKILEEH